MGKVYHNLSLTGHSREDQGPRIIISGGGTGGHLFPGIAIGSEL